MSEEVFNVLEKQPDLSEGNPVMTARGIRCLAEGYCFWEDAYGDDFENHLPDSFYWSYDTRTKQLCYSKHRDFVLQKAKEGKIIENIYSKQLDDIIKFANCNYILYELKNETPIFRACYLDYSYVVNYDVIEGENLEILKKQIIENEPNKKFYFLDDIKAYQKMSDEERYNFEKLHKDNNEVIIYFEVRDIQRTYLLSFYSKEKQLIKEEKQIIKGSLTDILKEINTDENNDEKYFLAIPKNDYSNDYSIYFYQPNINNLYCGNQWEGASKSVFLMKVGDYFLSSQDFGLLENDVSELSSILQENF